MARDEVFRHPYEELRRITELPLSEVALLGHGEVFDHLARLLDGAEAVERTRRDGWTELTRLVITGDGPAVGALLERAPPPRTCVVLSTGGGFPAGRLPVPGMCLGAELSRRGDHLHAALLPEASTVPEALELVAELLYAVGVELEQRPVDGPPA